ncbi:MULTISPECIES: bifunctional 2-polyprenyl-6-hydroxyphenol methylase/3-demethylubiquinol 3-O-methyltransferase UbiG [Psychrobacter]|jgi:2-polyprenyl-6-hydroxyphenyl methylase/3-demethylubiquinone-9 3-methyltransferase|uniref:bifunctional 2-polyprenyl-6-hydroxyphenol methylase/3-demethylubiquinol 3-O-methyltransferase UbiG n=1 Tax=Psychrobacter TaxID=497 RepID=UPI000EBD1C0E|nr:MULTISPECIES: bifunctional 2-polyprenyl-6-hydroxyphenol methylase/3-demethylubiquinol 3-O-methyltransferase UbiG [Psychrobacter]HCN17395.1 bifunctional 3-demethylubiquinol 3-O-methyltransferase/2-polyprenyl-6-hydroxyphenol methylase [Psychrobacter sp.]|tara:strand:- start:1443 stop:2288 length:846 start_codon:yes stop_codon:yes gene_type:complete
MSSALSSAPSSEEPANSNLNETDHTTTAINVDPSEVEKFNKLADEWWSNTGAFATLHEINPLRLNWIEENVKRGYQHDNARQDVHKTATTGLTGKKVLDVGCGGGILSESMARRGADVTGIDLGTENLKAAALHAEQSGLEHTLRYQHIPVETLAKTHAGQFDVVTCMEMLEHVPDPSSIVQACFDLLAPGGVCVLSTINRNPKSYLFAIVGAEYVLRLLDRGTHDYAKFITPAELDKMAINTGFTRQDIIGLHYNPLTKRYWLAQNVDVNYMLAVQKPLA